MDTPPPTEFENMTLLQIAEHYHGLVYKYNKSEGGVKETEELEEFVKMLRGGSPRETPYPHTKSCKVSKWIDAKKQKPESGIAVLVHLKRGQEDYYDLAYWWSKQDASGGVAHWSPFQDAHDESDVRHWMPIPNLPKQKTAP